MVYEYYHSDELMHSGIKGMKHGVRRFQNLDRTWTEAGKIRYGSGKKRETASESVGKIVSKAKARVEAGRTARSEKQQQRKAEAEKAKQAKRERKEAEALKNQKEADEKAEVERLNKIRKKPTDQLTASEISELTARLDMEKKYNDLVKSAAAPKLFDGKKMISDTLQESGKKVLSATITYLAIRGINRALKTDIPGGGKKDEKER